MEYFVILLVAFNYIQQIICRDEMKIMKACYWPNEIYEPCFGGCAEVSCDNPRNHLRPCYPYCEPGCVCEEPYVRDDRTHQCVLPQDCSPTQMGIPVPVKRTEKQPISPSTGKFINRLSRVHTRRDDIPADFGDNDMTPNNMSNANTNANQKEDYKRGNEMTRMGNYFNIVIAPPPIKALQPRKLLKNEPYRIAADKRIR